MSSGWSSTDEKRSSSFFELGIMKFALGLACLMTLASVQGAPQAGPPQISEDDLAPWCKTPPCPAYLNVNLPYRLDCLQYVECNKGVSVIKACSNGQQFNEAEGKCMDPKIANCVPCWQKAIP